MTADATPHDDSFADLLLACEEALVASTFELTPDTPPELRARLERNLECLRLLHRVLPRGDRAPSETGGTEVSEKGTLGRFELRRRLGQGAFGVVWLAYDTRLKREAALKVPHAGALADEGLRRRFVREAEAAAGLEHPNIVAVYEAGDEGPVCFLVSAYCAGPNLAQWLRQGDQPVPARDAAALVAALADGVDQAHRRGVVHRDLKPANVMLASEGGELPPDGSRPPLAGLVPKITDFGLARVLADAEAPRQTQSGAVLGTPVYMAPEQAAAKQEQIGPAADIWALGVILYELLTGRTPFQADTTLETLLLVQTEEPIPPGRLRRGVPRDLEWISLKCLSKEPSRRYADAAQLAGELRRFLDGLPLAHTRPVSPAERAVRWCRRNPRVALLLAALVLSLLGGLGFSLGFAWRAEVEAGVARTQKGLAEQETLRTKEKEAETRSAKERLDRSLYLVSMQLAQQAWEEGAMDRLRELLERQRPEWTGGIDHRGFEWHYWWRCLHANLMTIHADPSMVRASGSADGRFIVGNSYQWVKFWDAATGQEVRTLTPTPTAAWEVAYSGDGQHLAGVTRGTSLDAQGKRSHGYLKVWNAATGEETLSIPVPGGTLGLAFGSDGTRVAARVWPAGVADGQNGIKVWDIRTGVELYSFPGEQGAAFSPNGQRLACVGPEGRVKVRELETGKEVLAFQMPGRVVGAVAFNPDGQRLACALGTSQGVCLWDLVKNNPLQVFPADLNVNALAFSPDGERLAFAGSHRTIRVVDLASGRELVRLKGHSQSVESLAFLPDGWRLVSGGADGTIKVWDTMQAQEALTLPYARYPYCAAFNAGGDRVAVGGNGEAIKVFDAVAGKEQVVRGRPADYVHSMSFSPDGDTLAAFANQAVRLWSLAADKTGPTFPCQCQLGGSVYFGPDGRQLVILDVVKGGDRAQLYYFTARTWDPHSGATRDLVQVPVPDANAEGHLSADCRRMVVQSAQSVSVWDLETGQELWALASGACLKTTLSPDGHSVACSLTRPRSQVKVWEVATGREMLALDGLPDLTYALAISPDSHRLATGGYDGIIRLWDLANSGESVLALKGHQSHITCLAFSPDGHRLVSTSEGQAKLWDAVLPATEGRRRSALASAIRFHRVRSRIVSARRAGPTPSFTSTF